MHLEVNTVTSKGRKYRYARLVRGYRKDGKPAKKVLANLGQLPPQMIENLRVALQAAREGKAVVLEDATSLNLAPPTLAANYAWLDVAVCLDVWNRWSLTPLLDRLLPRQRDEVSPGTVVCALAIHRCLQPGSKHKAPSWFGTTALPELLGVAPEQLNNSRVHRVLSALDEACEPLQGSLPRLRKDRRGPISAMFLDVTDAWFEGRGCSLAERARTKEGLRNRRKIGIVLLCEDAGFPLRWEVVEGKRADHLAMGDMIQTIQDCWWVGDWPVVLDRAMGKASALNELLRSGLRFVTAVPRNEIESHTTEIPHEAFSDYEPKCELDPTDEAVEDVKAARKAFKKDVERVRAIARKAGLEEVDATLFVLDLGRAVRPLADEEPQWVGPDDLDPESYVGAASALAWARIFERMLRCGEVKHRAALAKATGLSRARVTEILNLLRLDPELQEEVLAGRYGSISDHPMRAVVKLKGAAAQRAALEEYARRQAANPTGRKMRPRKLRTTETHRLRRVAYFNPELLVRKRLRHRRRHRRLKEFVDELNHALRAPRSRKTEDDVRFAVTDRLSHAGVLRMFDFEVERHEDADKDTSYLQVKLQRKEEEWRRRRRYSGFVLLVGHESLKRSAAEFAALYRSKDMVERDFRVIKSEIELRPLYHRTDAKIRAHVAVCMLALLLKRAIESRLIAAGRSLTAAACLEQLQTCHLNRYARDEVLDSYYSVTRPDQEQRALLRALGLKALGDNRKVTKRIVPRDA